MRKVVKSKNKTGFSIDELYVPKLEWYSVSDRFLKEFFVTRQSNENSKLNSQKNSLEMSIGEEEFDTDDPPSSSPMASSSFIESSPSSNINRPVRKRYHVYSNNHVDDVKK